MNGLETILSRKYTFRIPPIVMTLTRDSISWIQLYQLHDIPANSGGANSERLTSGRNRRSMIVADDFIPRKLRDPFRPLEGPVDQAGLHFQEFIS